MGKTIREVLGICGDKNWDIFNQKGISNPATIFDNVRYFLHSEDMYQSPSGRDNQKTPNTFTPVFCPQTCDKQSPCENQPWSGINDTFNRYECLYPSFRGDTVFAVAKIFMFDGFRQFPAKHCTREEWGGTIPEIEKNASILAEIIEKYFPSITHLEMNEYWIPNDVDVYQAVMRGFNKTTSRVKLLTTSVQSTNVNEGGSLYDNHVSQIFEVPFENELGFVDGITMHPYPFVSGSQSGTPASLSDKPENKFLTEIRDMVKWNESDASLPLQITEIGWNSGAIGEQKQADYLCRGLFLAMAYGIEKYYIYELIDQPTDGLFNSCGLLRPDLSPKLAYNKLRDLLDEYGDYEVTDLIEDGDSYEVIMESLTGEVSVKWNSNEDGITYLKKTVDEGASPPSPQYGERYLIELASNTVTSSNKTPEAVAEEIIAIAKELNKKLNK